MNILNRNRNRRKTSSSRMSTAADACETRSLLCAAAIPVGELVTTEVETPVESSDAAEVEFVDATSFEETPGLEVFTCFDAEVTSAKFDGSQDGSVVEEVTFSEEELSRLAAGMFSMFSMMVGEDGSELPPEAFEMQPELAVCTFGPEFFDEHGVPVEVTSEVEFDPATYDLTSLEGWDPSWAFRGVVVDGVDPSLDSSQFDPTTEGTEEFVVDGSLDGLIPVEVDLDGDGIPDGYTWVSEDNLPKEEHSGSDVPEDGDSEVPSIYWFAINDSAGSEFDADGNPIYYMTGSPDGGEWYEEVTEEVTEDGEVKVTLEDTFDGDVTVIEPSGQVLFMNTLFATPMLDVPMVPIQMEASIAARSEGVPSMPELQNGPAGLPIVRIPVMRPQSSVFQPQTNSASTTSVQTQETAATRTETPVVQQTPTTPTSRIRGASVARLSRPASAPTTELQTLSPLLGEQPAEEANEDPVVPQQVEEAQTVVPDATTEQETVWVPTRERRSIDMFMSDFADDSYIG